MWFLKPKHTLESVARQLVEGLENGNVILRVPGCASNKGSDSRLAPTEGPPREDRWEPHWQTVLGGSYGPFRTYLRDPSATRPTARHKRSNGESVRLQRLLVA